MKALLRPAGFDDSDRLDLTLHPDASRLGYVPAPLTTNAWLHTQSAAHLGLGRLFGELVQALVAATLLVALDPLKLDSLARLAR